MQNGAKRKFQGWFWGDFSTFYDISEWWKESLKRGHSTGVKFEKSGWFQAISPLFFVSRKTNEIEKTRCKNWSFGLEKAKKSLQKADFSAQKCSDFVLIRATFREEKAAAIE